MAVVVTETKNTNINFVVLLSLLLLSTTLTVSQETTPELPQSITDVTDEAPQTIILGILPPLTDEHTTAVLETNMSVGFVFSAVNISGAKFSSIESYWEAKDELLNKNVDALVGPFMPHYSVASQKLGIPYLVTSQLLERKKTDDFLIELFPNAQVFARAVLDIIRYFGHTKVAVVYDSQAGAIILEKLLHQPWMEVTAYKMEHTNTTLLRHALKTMRDQYYEVYVCVLGVDETNYVLDEALSLSMFSQHYRWFLVNIRLDEFMLEKYVDSRANVTVLRLMMDYNSKMCLLQPGVINLKRAILHDAVRVFSSQTLRGRTANIFRRHANTTMEHDGCTGRLKFTRVGRREECFLQLISLQGYRSGAVTDEDFEKLMDFSRRKSYAEGENKLQYWGPRLSGTWRSAPSELNQRVVPSKSYSLVSHLSRNGFGSGPLRITTLLEPPFIQWRKDSSAWREKGVSVSNHTGELEGMCVDILKEMAQLLSFTFTVTLVSDGKYGSLKATGWTGMVRELLEDKADVALAPFQLRVDRSAVVDFTKPFMTKGTTVVVKRPEEQISFFQFLAPLSQLVWCGIFFSFVAVSLVLFGVSRVNSDRSARYTGNLRESFWYIWGTLLRGSLSGSPHAISSRIVSSAWWFFCLIVTSIYTANLAAFLTIAIGDAGINSAADLARQEYYDYGTINGSQTETFFNHTRMPEYARMWAYMSTLSPQSMVRRTEDGFERVRKGRYAFIWDTPTIRYEISNDCDLMEVGDSFDNKGYGFAFQKHALYGERLSWALLKLNDAGVLYRLERKWWRPQFCPNQRHSAKTKSLSLETVAGMYLVILAGIASSGVLCLAQYCLTKGRITRRRESHDDQTVVTSQQEPLRASNDIMNPLEDNLTYPNYSSLAFQSMATTNWS